MIRGRKKVNQSFHVKVQSINIIFVPKIIVAQGWKFKKLKDSVENPGNLRNMIADPLK